MSIGIDTISKFIAIATGIVALIEGIVKVVKLLPVVDKWKLVISVGQWLFLVITTLGLVSIALATLGAYFGSQGQGDINEQFRNSVGFATAFSLLYGVFWGSVIRPWLMNK